MNQPAQSHDRTVIVTGADANYFRLLEGAMQSIHRHRERLGFDLVVLDFGLTDPQKTQLQDNYQVRIVQPAWLIDLPAKLRTPGTLALAIRPVLPQIVPSYDIYFWFDADGWAQDESFFEHFIGAARQGMFAVVREEEPVYPFDWSLQRWNLGNQVLAFGPLKGARVYLSPAINAGFFAARGDHPVWNLWRKRYEEAVRRSGKGIMDQHALRATIALDRVPTRYLTGVSNWICYRAKPMYDRDRDCLCVPYPPYEKISVLHLAGSGPKDLEYDLKCIGGGIHRTGLTYQQVHGPVSDCVSANA